jgi:hypothetical protein
MQRLALLIILLTIVSALTILFALAETKRRPEWQQELDNYIRAKSSFLVVHQVAPASHPQYLHQFISNAYLPLLPEAVWCVLLRQTHYSDGKSSHIYSVVFVSFYSEIHWDIWHVYEGQTQPFSPSFRDDLPKLGCNLALNI